MSGVTQSLYATLCSLREAEVEAQGERLTRAIWSRLPRSAAPAAAPTGDAETAAFDNALRFAREECERDEDAELPFLAVPVFAATALAHARELDCSRLFVATGTGIEGYARIVAGLGEATAARGFDARVIAATLAAVVACARIEELPAGKAAEAIGLASSAITGHRAGDLPLQLAIAARDGIVMARLMSCGFRGPPDALACQWGVLDVFGDRSRASAIDVRSSEMSAASCLPHEASARTSAPADSISALIDALQG
jgi:hypothetical protein